MTTTTTTQTVSYANSVVGEVGGLVGDGTLKVSVSADSTGRKGVTLGRFDKSGYGKGSTGFLSAEQAELAAALLQAAAKNLRAGVVPVAAPVAVPAAPVQASQAPAKAQKPQGKAQGKPAKAPAPSVQFAQCSPNRKVG